MEWSFKLERTSLSTAVRRNASEARLRTGWMPEDRSSWSRLKRMSTGEVSLLDQTTVQAQKLYGRALSRSRQTWSKASFPHVETSSLLDSTLHKKSSDLSTSASQIHFKCKSLSTSLVQTKLPRVWISSVHSVDTMKNELATVKSDLLELKRDTATYDYCFTSSKQTYEVLTSVDHVADHSTELTATLESVTDGQQSISAFIRNKLEALHSLKTQSLILKNEERSIPKLEYGLRESQGGDKFEKLFAGAVVISGMHCLIRATGNEIFKKLGIFGQTINGSRLDQLLISVKEKTFDVRSFIHTKLYLTVDKGNIRLLAHENYGKSFVQLLISLPEHQYTYAKITSKGESLWIFLPEIGEVQYKLENDLHSLNVRKVRGFVSKSLHHNPVTNQISWVGHFASSLRFALKESKSRLLNPEYLAKLLETECQTKNRYHYMCNGLRITIELSQCGVYEHLLLYTEKKTVTIEETDEMHGFLTGLQITDFRSNWQTLMKSLEMKMCVTVLLAKGEL